MAPRLVVFDLDGTLIDSRIDLANSVNAMLLHLGKPELPHAVIATYIGDGASMLVRRALRDREGDVHDEDYVAEGREYFTGYYRVQRLDYGWGHGAGRRVLDAVGRTNPEVPM